jgi:hypothetical protein
VDGGFGHFYYEFDSLLANKYDNLRHI